MTMHKPDRQAVATDTWGTWEDATRGSHEAFRMRSPLARLAWLEDLLSLRQAAIIKLVAIEPQDGTTLLLRFSDGAWGVFDCASLIEANTQMTAPLRDADFFSHHFIEAGALAWPNGFDLSGHSLYRRLEESGDLHRDTAAA